MTPHFLRLSKLGGQAAVLDFEGVWLKLTHNVCHSPLFCLFLNIFPHTLLCYMTGESVVFEFNRTSTFDRYSRHGGRKRRLNTQDRYSSRRGDSDVEDDGKLHGGPIECLCVRNHSCHARGRHTLHLRQTGVRGDGPGYMG